MVALLLILFQAGCMVGPDYKKPVVQTPEKFRFETFPDEAAVNLQWWELFNDPILESLVSIALADNKDVLIAASRIEQARAALGFTRADLYPKIDIEAQATRGNLAGRTKSDTTSSNFFIGPALNWEIDF